jgi:hypothetical protein
VKALAECALRVLLLTIVIAGVAEAQPATRASCPLHTGSPSGGDVQWGFSETGPPSSRHQGIRSSYTHGRGNWTNGRASGVVCSQDSLTNGPARNLVLSVAGTAKLSPRVTELGLLGVRLMLTVRVTASDDGGCATGTHGTITLFASYYAIHRDALTLHFVGGCAAHNLAYASPRLHVLITRHGAQVNTA